MSAAGEPADKEASLPERDPSVVLSFQNVSRTFGKVYAVDRMSLDLHENEIVTLLGPSGCGKTTTLRMGIGLEKSSEGRIAYRGKTIDCVAERIFVPPERRNMGMVFQSYAVWPHLSVFDNVAYPLSARRVAKDEIARRVRETLALVGLNGYEDRFSTQLSGGQQQRVAVARGLVFNPDILLMDEPFSNLDAKLREQMRIDVKLLQRRLGFTILFVTHDQSEALAISDRIVVMNAGRMQAIGKPIDLYLRPPNRIVRDFLGQTVALDGHLETIAGGIASVQLGNGRRMLATTDGAAPAAVGAPCSLSIRPEHIVVSASPDASGAENALSATIQAIQFRGDRLEAAVTVETGTNATVFLPVQSGWSEAQAVTLTFPREAFQLWSEGDGR